MKAEQENQKIEPKSLSVSVTPMDMLQMALQQNADIDKLQKLMDLQDRWEKSEAKKAFLSAKSEFKGNMPKVYKDKYNKQYDSYYTSIGHLVNTVDAFLSPCGLSAEWKFDQSAGIKVTCTLTHRLGHSESVSLSGPLDTSGSKNSLQQIKSTVTYLKLATFEAVTGVASINDDSDDDGNGSVDNITEKQVADIEALLVETKKPDKELSEYRKEFCAWLGADTLEVLPATDYKRAVHALEGKRKK